MYVYTLKVSSTLLLGFNLLPLLLLLLLLLLFICYFIGQDLVAPSCGPHKC